ncbi:sigma-70 family RNA polymerase sigma factor [Fulvivirgaceae bacterium PWU5]|jgi:RNA polymerase sigma-70 factor (family 1)|uniref:Sigma-70 family RNA polymerase sigma factor n=1 Tax=Dawidia cretensis TaxID=2782350 RepID=A0AAP2E0F4_9BACT|nr:MULTISPECIES: sigma-70 family RNA polymerase sigma factor [Cytophagales]MBT1709204.1 sigma-70 family RNA polymerase sigma factor [Dawidia cretensis]MCD9017434.1 sigma-70 family RNA polymerase sigma factor [Parachryseolinea silvisoli]
MHSNVNEAMLRRMAKGDEEAFRQIYDLYWDVIYHFIRKKVGSKQFAEDVAQEIFTSLWARRTEFTDVQNLKHYLAMWSRNHALRLLKRIASETQAQREYTFTLDRGAPDINSDEILYEEKRYKDTLHGAVNALTPRQQEVFRLAKVEGLSHKEIAERLNITPFSVKKHVYDAMLLIRERFRGHIAYLALLLIYWQ